MNDIAKWRQLGHAGVKLTLTCCINTQFICFKECYILTHKHTHTHTHTCIAMQPANALFPQLHFAASALCYRLQFSSVPRPPLADAIQNAKLEWNLRCCDNSLQQLSLQLAATLAWHLQNFILMHIFHIYFAPHLRLFLEFGGGTLIDI